jgi:hypothetical protein
MQLMMVASNCQQGQMDVRDGQLIPMNRSCSSKWDSIELPLVAPNLSLAEAPLATAKRSKETSPKMSMVTPMSLPTPKNLLYGTTPNRDNRLLTAMDVTTPEGAIKWNRVPELVSIELVLHLYFVNGLNVSKVNDEFAHHQVPLPSTFDIGSLITMSPKNHSNATSNVKKARQHFVNGLHGCFVPRESDLLHKWYANSKRYSYGDGLEATNTQLDPQSRVHTLSLDAIFLLRHIMYTHKITVSNILSLWASFYTLIIKQQLDTKSFISQTSLWNNVQRLHYIDQALATNFFLSRSYVLVLGMGFIGISTCHLMIWSITLGTGMS